MNVLLCAFAIFTIEGFKKLTTKIAKNTCAKYAKILFPLASFHQLFNLAFHEIALQGTDMANVKLAVQVVGFVKKGPR
jgi:hypothetical protein